LSGPVAGNYALGATTTTANITPELTIAGTSGADSITLVKDADHVHIDWFLNGAANLGQLSFDDPYGLTINGNGGNDAISLDYTNGNPLPALIHLNGTFTLFNLQGTNPLAGTTLDIGRSTLFITYGGADPLSVIQTYLQNGYSSGTWAGTPTASNGVITSLAAELNPNHNTAIGYADAGDGTGINPVPNTIELSYTLLGDANLDGLVNSVDLQRLLSNFNSSGSWTGGDFNYDGMVNSADLQDLLSNFNTSLSGQIVSAASNATSVAPSSSVSVQATAPQPVPAPAGTVHPAIAPKLPAKQHRSRHKLFERRK
jgi:hypothetical protein